MKFGIRLTLFIILAATFVIVPMFWWFSLKQNRRILDELTESANLMATRYTYEIETDLHEVSIAAHTLAKTFESMRQNETIDRLQLVEILRQVLVDNPSYVGVWSVWEPHATGEHDSLWINTPQHDHTGQFAPYWHRLSNSLHYQVLQSYDDSASTFYRLAKTTQTDVVIPPTAYEINGKEVVLTSFVSPIVFGGEFFGAIGIDIKLDSLQHYISRIRPYEHGSATLYASDGTVLADSDPDNIGKNYLQVQTTAVTKDAELFLDAIKQGNALNKITFCEQNNNSTFVVFKPIELNKDQSWTLSMSFPVEIYKEKTAYNRQTTIVFIFVGIILFAIVTFLIVNRSIQPLTRAFIVAEQTAQGNLDFEIKPSELKLSCEIGQLMNALQKMQYALKLKLETMNAEDRNRDWLKTGENTLLQAMRGNQKLEQVAKNIITALSTYIDAQIGLLYLFDGEKMLLQLQSQFAVAELTDKVQAAHIGEGLLGEAIQQDEILELNDLPPSFSEASSKIIKLAPRHLLIVPIVFEEQVIGVLEFGFFNRPDSIVKQLLNENTENIAVGIKTADYRERLENLFERRKEHKKEILRNIKELKDVQKESQRTEAELKSIIDAIDHTILRAEYSLDGNIISVNNKYASVLQCDPASIQKHNVREFIPPHQYENFKEVWKKVCNGKVYEGIVERKDRTGRTHRFSMSYTPITKASGRVYKILFLATKINDELNHGKISS